MAIRDDINIKCNYTKRKVKKTKAIFTSGEFIQSAVLILTLNDKVNYCKAWPNFFSFSTSFSFDFLYYLA